MSFSFNAKALLLLTIFGSISNLNDKSFTFFLLIEEVILHRQLIFNYINPLST